MSTMQEHTVKSITLHIGGQSFFMNRGSLNLALFQINHGPRVTNVTDFKRAVLQHQVSAARDSEEGGDLLKKEYDIVLFPSSLPRFRKTGRQIYSLVLVVSLQTSSLRRETEILVSCSQVRLRLLGTHAAFLWWMDVYRLWTERRNALLFLLLILCLISH